MRQAASDPRRGDEMCEEAARVAEGVKEERWCRGESRRRERKRLEVGWKSRALTSGRTDKRREQRCIAGAVDGRAGFHGISEG
jgi:hypothetical protein